MKINAAEITILELRELEGNPGGIERILVRKGFEMDRSSAVYSKGVLIPELIGKISARHDPETRSCHYIQEIGTDETQS